MSNSGDGSDEQANDTIIEKYCYNDLESNCDVYGGLYQWDELMNYSTSSNNNPSGVQGICLAGWHIPSDAEWCQVETYLDPTANCNAFGWIGTDAGGKMKEAGYAHWAEPNTGATNSSGFTALPGGRRDEDATFCCLTSFTSLWSSTEQSDFAWVWGLAYDFDDVLRINIWKTFGCSGRCLKD